jgi:hypothetical protein
MSSWTECSRIDEIEADDLLLLCSFDKRSLDETFENIGEYAYYVDIH